MSLVTTFRVGGVTCHALEAGRQRLDGGAMFGVVPKPLWERRIPADDRNRIPLALRCFLVEHQVGPILVDTGAGNKESEKFIDIYGLENAGSHGRPTRLEDALAEAGVAPGDVRFVVNTHLHFDHAGGNAFVAREEREEREEPESLSAPERQGGGGGTPRPAPRAGGEAESGAKPRLSFPNATYVVQRRELAFATHTNERTAASYLAHNVAPVSAADRWHLVDGEVELVKGIRLVPTPGHVPFHQSVLVEDGGETACFLGDLVPTSAHLPLPWIMGYDLEPLVTLETKRRLLGRAADEGWILVFEHDPERGVGRAVRQGKSFGYAPLDTP